MATDKRKQQLMEWLQAVLGTSDFSCEPASMDASFRRYFRLTLNEQSYIVMDAPPDKEDCRPFVSIATLLLTYGINAPRVFHQSIELGFLVLSDFGHVSYLDKLTDRTASKYYDDAVNELHKMHQIPLANLDIPTYDAALLKQEMNLFGDWFLVKLLGVELSGDERESLMSVHTALVQSALQQPQVFVHRDYHSRNLMLSEAINPGVIDFQDAVIGPLTYDLASLYRDCYIEWPDQQVYKWLDVFLQQRQERGCDEGFDTSCFYQWFDWMGAQRHMKAVGIFSRLLLRDNKAGYLKDIPRTLEYLMAVCLRYDALKPLANLLLRHDVSVKFDQYLKGQTDL